MQFYAVCALFVQAPSGLDFGANKADLADFKGDCGAGAAAYLRSAQTRAVSFLGSSDIGLRGFVQFCAVPGCLDFGTNKADFADSKGLRRGCGNLRGAPRFFDARLHILEISSVAGQADLLSRRAREAAACEQPWRANHRGGGKCFCARASSRERLAHHGVAHSSRSAGGIHRLNRNRRIAVGGRAVATDLGRSMPGSGSDMLAPVEVTPPNLVGLVSPALISSSMVQYGCAAFDPSFSQTAGFSAGALVESVGGPIAPVGGAYEPTSNDGLLAVVDRVTSGRSNQENKLLRQPG